MLAHTTGDSEEFLKVWIAQYRPDSGSILISYARVPPRIPLVPGRNITPIRDEKVRLAFQQVFSRGQTSTCILDVPITSRCEYGARIVSQPTFELRISLASRVGRAGRQAGSALCWSHVFAQEGFPALLGGEVLVDGSACVISNEGLLTSAALDLRQQPLSDLSTT